MSKSMRNIEKKPYYVCGSPSCYWKLRGKFLNFLDANKYEVSEIEDNSMIRWTKVTYLAKYKAQNSNYFKFIFESKNTPNGMNVEFYAIE